MPRCFVVYILSNESRQLYVGVTSHLERRLWQHRSGTTPGYASARNLHTLVYWEHTPNASAAILREKEIKGLRRSRKIGLIERENPEWRDLSQDLRRSGASAPSLRSG